MSLQIGAGQSGTAGVGTRIRTDVDQIAARLRLLIVVGIPVGVLVAGVGSRLAMLLLRLTSPDSVHGVTSDDGFRIGEVTIGGTYNLLVIGALVGILGAATYLAVAPWLLGPLWFRRLTVAAASGAVVGSMLVHADGIDFVLLQPTWLAIGLFVALPAVFGAAIAHTVDAALRHEAEVVRQGHGRSALHSWGPHSWGPPVLLVALFPPSLVLVGVSTLVLAVWIPLRNGIGSTSVPVAAGLVVRLVWLSIAVAGLVALVRDVRAIV